MKNEHAFNGSFAKELKKLGPDLNYVKISDKYRLGISDFLIFAWDTTVALEAKHVPDWGVRDSGKLLKKHCFEGPQVTFLRQIARTGNRAFGCIFCATDDTVYLVEHDKIPDNGNWTIRDFREHSFPCFPRRETLQIVEHLFGR